MIAQTRSFIRYMICNQIVTIKFLMNNFLSPASAKFLVIQNEKPGTSNTEKENSVST